VDIEAGQIDCVLVYKVDRLSRSLLDFARLMEIFERCQVSLVYRMVKILEAFENVEPAMI
jgi:DNA invertase Pin-like site-specific DNA recombinase